MKAFTLIAETHQKSGEASPFMASVGSPVWTGDLYECSLNWVSAGIVRRFTGPFSEAVYRRACAFVRGNLWRREMCLVSEGRKIEFMPPVFTESESVVPNAASSSDPMFFFDVAEFEGFIRNRKGDLYRSIVRIGPPYRLEEYPPRYACSCYFSWYGELGPIFGSSTDEAYNWAFRLIRSLLIKRSEELIDDDGRLIVVTAPMSKGPDA